MSAQSVDPEAVRSRLERVTDPELDRSIVELDYVESVDLDGAAVTVRFALPTAWCSPVFAWMMALDAREAVSELPGVESATVELIDHMHEEEINRGINRGLPFDAVFDDAEGGIEEVRREFDEKARAARQYDAVEALRDAGLSDRQIASLTRADVSLGGAAGRAVVRAGGLRICADEEPLAAYLEKAERVGVAEAAAAPLFVDPDGDPIDPDGVDRVQRFGRLARTNMGGQGGICSGLHEARNPDLARRG